MHTRSLLPLYLAVAGLALPAGASEVIVRTDVASFPAHDVRSLRIDIPIGEVTIAAASADTVEARLTLKCDEDSRRCHERADALSVKPARQGAALELKVAGSGRRREHGPHHPQLQLQLSVPRQLDVRVDMGVGEVDLAGVEGDVSVDLGVGEVRVRVPERAVQGVSVLSGVGEASLQPRYAETHHRGFLFLGNEIHWNAGSGRSRVHVEVGVGEANVRMEP